MSLSTPPPDDASPQPGPWRIRFGMKALFIVTFLVAVLAAVLGGLLREGDDLAESPRAVLYIIMAVAAPVLVMIGVSVWTVISDWLGRSKRPPH